MKTFKITEHIEIICESERTRYGFRHLAYLMIDGREISKAKCCYYNRTWERYEFQSVAQKLIRDSDYLSEADKKLCDDWLEGDRTDWSQFRMVSAIAKMGDLICDNQKDKNDWKTRMIKAGFGDAIQIPEDWDELSEEEKGIRLNKTIEMLGAVPNDREQS